VRISSLRLDGAVMVSGSQDFFKRKSDPVISLGSGTLSIPKIVGEMSLLDNQPRSATVVAKTPLRVLVMDPSQFAAVFSDPHAAQWIAASLSHRLRAHLKSTSDRTPELH